MYFKEGKTLVKQVFTDFLKGIAVTGATIVLLLGMVVLTGCPETQNMMKPVVNEPADTKPPTMVGEVKKPEEKPTTEPEKPGPEEKPVEPKEQEEAPEEESVEPAEDPVTPKPVEPAVPAEEITVEVAYYNDAALTDNLAAALYADVWDSTFNHFSPGGHCLCNGNILSPFAGC